ncbi:MAG: rod shape-determining protein RodA [Bacteroidota bacterium]|nr:rod shape-determining protein RodA [Bacteroidota bacterium]
MNSFFKEHFDHTTLWTTLALIVIGLLSIYSATFDMQAGRSFDHQLVWTAIGLVLMIVALATPLRLIQRSAYIVYALSLALLIIVLAIGKKVYGSTSWFGIGGFGIQPSEFVKVTTLLALASYLSRSDVSIGKTTDILKACGFVLLPVALIMLQPDLGTSLTFIAMLLPVLYWAGASQFLIVALLTPPIIAVAALIGTTTFVVVLALVGVALYLLREDMFSSSLMFGVNAVVGIFVQVVYEKLALYQQKRISTFLNPNNDPLGAGYNVIQAKVAIGSGGLFGKGYLHGTQTQLNFIPKQWTDFIFCVPGEEFGFIGAIVILTLFAILFLHGVKLAHVAKNKFGSITALGITALFAFHMFVNIGMSVGLMPVIGIPLPFLSYGGSSLCSFMILAGLLMNVYANRKEY